MASWSLITGELPRSIDRLILPPRIARAGWYFDSLAIIEAMKKLEITRPVRIRFTSGGIRVGSHRIRKEGFHRIAMNQNFDIEISNETLWHELTHASQAERWSRMVNRPVEEFYRGAYADGVAYRLKSWELEAEMNAIKYSKYMLLVSHDPRPTTEDQNTGQEHNTIDQEPKTT